MGKKAVIYTRVSTDEQKESGFSLTDQEARLRKYCAQNDLVVVAHYEEDHSAKNFDRPKFKNFLGDLETGSIKPQLFLCIRPDRFSRNLEASLKMIKLLLSRGIKVKFLENNVDLDTPESKILYMLNLLLPEVDNERRSLNTRRGMRQAMREGRWVGSPPRGYSWDRSTGESLIIPNEDAKFIRIAFEMFGEGIYSMADLRRTLAEKSFQIGKNPLSVMLRNPVYCGKIRVKEWKDEPEMIVHGLHDSIIGERLFEKVQKILAGRKVQPVSKKKSDKLPLRGKLICNVCGQKLTGSKSRGNGGTYHYYHCQKSGHQRFRASNANHHFEEYLSSITIKEEIAKLYFNIVQDVFRKDDDSRQNEIQQYNNQLKHLEIRKQNVIDKFVDGEITNTIYRQTLKRYQSDIDLIEIKLSQIKSQRSSFEQYWSFGLHLLTHLDQYYLRSDLETKQRIIGSIFPDFLVYDGESYRTTKSNPILELISLNISDLGELKKDSSLNESFKAPPQGLEPWTYGLTVRRSNQLS